MPTGNSSITLTMAKLTMISDRPTSNRVKPARTSIVLDIGDSYLVHGEARLELPIQGTDGDAARGQSAGHTNVHRGGAGARRGDRIAGAELVHPPEFAGDRIAAVV